MALKLTFRELDDVLAARDYPWRPQPLPFEVASLPRARRRLGYRRAASDLTREQAEARARGQDHTRRLGGRYPTHADLRDVSGVNYVTPVRYQGECGACVAFGTLATLEATKQFEAHDAALQLDYSEAHLFHCSGGCLKCAFGWRIPDALERLQSIGVVDDACLPYKPGGGCGTLCPDWPSRVTKIASASRLQVPEEMKMWLSSSGALVATMSIYEDFFYYASGTYQHVTGRYVGEHCICCVGYDDQGRYWTAKNSWGPAWGTRGFFAIQYGDCGYGAEMWAMIPA